MIKKPLALILVVLMTISLLSGCGGSATANPDSATSPASSTKPVTISVFCSYAGEEPHGQYVYKYAKAFMEKHPNITVKITAVASNDIYTKLSAMAASPDDLPTLFFTSADNAPSFKDLGIMEDLNKYLDKNTLSSFAPGIVKACTLENSLVYYPIAVQPFAVIYRTDRFKEAGLSVPKTWDEFLNCAKKLTKDTNGDGRMDQWGFSMVGSNNSSGQSRFLGYLWSNGINVISSDGGKWKTDVDSDSFLKAFSFWTDMNNKYGVVPTGITQVDYPTAANYFAMGYTNMMMTGSNAIGVAYASNKDLKGKIGSFTIPGSQSGTMLNTEGYALCKNAKEEEKAAAVEFLKFFSTNDKDLMFWQASGKIPATTEGEKAAYISGEDYAGYLETIKKGCHESVNFPGMNGVKTQLGQAYSAVFSKESSNKDAATKLDASLKKLLEDYN